MRRSVLLLLALAGVLAVAGCGGSGKSNARKINGCTIEPDTSCMGANLAGANLSDEDLSGADLTVANLNRAKLRDTNLSGANLTGATLKNATISNANLDDANLTRTDLTGATITGTDLDGATLCGTIRTNGTTDDTDCPPSGGTTTQQETTTTAANLPRIVVFKGPSAVPCGKKGQVKTVVFKYETKNATAVEPEVDGESPGAQAGYDPDSGDMRFPYVCPGPHTVTITASNDKGQSASRSVGVVPED